MDKSIELRLLKQAERIAVMYQSDVTAKKYKELCNAIKVGYQAVETGDCEELYDVVQGDEGLWEYSVDDTLNINEYNMWELEVCILSCNCHIVFKRKHTPIPQDLEMQEENIPKLVEFLENAFQSKDDIEKFDEIWRKEICY